MIDFNSHPNLTYLDYNSSTPVFPEVLEVMAPFYSKWFFNPSGKYAVEIRNLINSCRSDIKKLLKAKEGEVLFYGGGTEAVNSIIKGLAFMQIANETGKNHIISASTEHDASTATFKYLEKLFNFKVTILDVDEKGVVNPDDVKAAITDKTFLISIMHVNNETGVLHPIKEISKISKEHNIHFHSDGIAAIGKVNINLEELGVDSYTAASHKFYGPKGVGINYIKDINMFLPIIHGSLQEFGLRGGTENAHSIIGLTKALSLVNSGINRYISHENLLLKRLESNINNQIDDFVLNSHPDVRVCNTLNISIKDTTSADLVKGMFEKGFATASGAASIGDAFSSVIKGMRVDPAYAKGTIRFSLGIYSTEEDVDKAANALAEVVKSVRG